MLLLTKHIPWPALEMTKNTPWFEEQANQFHFLFNEVHYANGDM